MSDPETYPDQEVFNLERFLGEDQQLNPHEACFGWGRRSCPGAHLAELSIFICVAMALATLDVSRYSRWVVDLLNTFCNHVKPFKCKIAPRSKKAQDLLHV